MEVDDREQTLSDDEARARFTNLFEATYSDLWAYALRRTRNRSDAEDIVAATYLVAWRRLEDVLAANAPITWLFGVAYRTLANQRRAQRRATALSQRIESEVSGAAQDDVSETAAAHDELTDVLRALVTLEERDQEVLRLAAFEGLSPSEIARVVGITPGLVRTHLHRARRRLRKALDAQRVHGTGEAR